MSLTLSELGEMVIRTGDDLFVRKEFHRRWLLVPRETAQPPAGQAPPGMRACPAPAVGRHELLPGHMYTEDGRCWVTC